MFLADGATFDRCIDRSLYISTCKGAKNTEHLALINKKYFPDRYLSRLFQIYYYKLLIIATSLISISAWHVKHVILPNQMVDHLNPKWLTIWTPNG